MAGNVTRMVLKIEGIVQGVGFRPFIYRLAAMHHLGGKVWNSSEGVVVDVEGTETDVKRFISDIEERVPSLARISGISCREVAPLGYTNFEISSSRRTQSLSVMVPPDMATCEECRENILDPMDRHYHYPFTNCTNCGPRFTIVQGLPYDRENTTMSSFIMCKDCVEEYTNPLDRRFHAQPTACPVCGPQLELVDRWGNKVDGNPLTQCQKLLKQGFIVAIKGLGGFHLACDAFNARVVEELRRRKKRKHKPFAIMCRDLETVDSYCCLSQKEKEILCSPAAPIVVLKKKNNCPLPEELAPGQNTLGVMLPYTPLHILLMTNSLPVLVMTSGNAGSLPICKDNDEAIKSLGDIADFFLWHNRPINNRCDDSVLGVCGDTMIFYRRARGFVPLPLQVPVDSACPVAVLGAGSDLKNTFCVLKENKAYMSQHIGDMGLVEVERHYNECLQNFLSLIDAGSELVAYDLHPAYRSSGAACCFENITKVAVQHHHAHMASCMAENGLEEEVIGAILDGTGYGTDGTIWGFEILKGNYEYFSREFHLAYLPLPGGDKAIVHPWRIAVAYLVKYGGGESVNLCKEFFQGREKDIDLIIRTINNEEFAPLVSSCGRFFDAIAALLGICTTISYEGQAAIELGELAPWLEGEKDLAAEVKKFNPYRFTINNDIIDPEETVMQLVYDIKRNVSAAKIARRFHDTVVAMVIESVKRVAQKSGLKKVVISGGCWQNRYLQAMTSYLLQEEGFEVFKHRQVPANDGGLSLGQALVGYWRWRSNVSGGSHAGSGAR